MNNGVAKRHDIENFAVLIADFVEEAQSVYLILFRLAMPAQRFPGFLRSLSWPIGSGYSIATGVSVFFLPSISRVLLLAVMRADDRGVVGLQLGADEPPKEARSRCLAASMMVPVSANGASTRSASVEILRASYSYSYPSRCGSTIYALKLAGLYASCLLRSDGCTTRS